MEQGNVCVSIPQRFLKFLRLIAPIRFSASVPLLLQFHLVTVVSVCFRNSPIRNYVFEITWIDEALPQREENCVPDTTSIIPTGKLTGTVLVCYQFIALYVKRYCNSKRNLKGFFCEVYYSYSFSAFTLSMLKKQTNHFQIFRYEDKLFIINFLINNKNIQFIIQ